MIYGKHLNEIPTPALVIDFDTLQENIKQMSAFLKQTNCALRPHFKTHKSVLIAKLQTQAGALGITCAKLGEAEELVHSGVDNILIANEIIDPSKVMKLACFARHSDITVAVDNLQNVQDLSSAAVTVGSTINVLIEVNIGLGRCGVRSHTEAIRLAEKISTSTGLILKGLMGYEGHCVWIENFEERAALTKTAIDTLLGYKDCLESKGYEIGIISCGGTGTYDISSRLPGVTEIQAGSYVFMDAKYNSVEGIRFKSSLSLISTIISVPEDGVAITDAGMKCLSTDNGLPKVVCPDGMTLHKLSEEHGTVTYSSSNIQPKVGDRVKIMPSHCCTTVNLHDKYYVTSNDTVIGIWPIDGRGKSN